MARFFWFVGILTMVLSGSCTFFFVQGLLGSNNDVYLIFTLVGLPPFLIGLWIYTAAKKKLAPRQTLENSTTQENKPPQD